MQHLCYIYFRELETDEKVAGATRRKLYAGQGVAFERVLEWQKISTAHAWNARARQGT